MRAISQTIVGVFLQEEVAVEVHDLVYIAQKKITFHLGREIIFQEFQPI